MPQALPRPPDLPLPQQRRSNRGTPARHDLTDIGDSTGSSSCTDASPAATATATTTDYACSSSPAAYSSHRNSDEPANSHLPDVLLLGALELSTSPIVPGQKDIRASRPAPKTTLIGGSRVSYRRVGRGGHGHRHGVRGVGPGAQRNGGARLLRLPPRRRDRTNPQPVPAGPREAVPAGART